MLAIITALVSLLGLRFPSDDPSLLRNYHNPAILKARLL